MRRLQIRSVYWAVLVAFQALSCADDVPTAPDFPSSVRTELDTHRSRFRSEVLFHQLSEEIGGFGGYWWDSQGNLHVNITDIARKDAAKAAVSAIFARYRPSAHVTAGANRTIIVHAARFNFKQLSAWRDDLFKDIAALGGVQSIGVNERLNRVTVGVVTNSPVNAVQAIAERIGIPRDGLTVFVEPPARELEQYLSDRLDPVFGGAKITTYGESGTPRPCTVGVNTFQGTHFLTTSHCSDTRGPEPLYPSTAYQPDVQPGVSTLLGIEVNDVYPFSSAENADCPSSQYVCRYSDAAIYQYQERAPGYAGQKLIYSTDYVGIGPFSPGSTRINGTLTIIDELPYAELGRTYDKLGQATGWTAGTLIDTCRHIQPFLSNYWTLCADEVAAAADGGDSGAAVFEWLGYNYVAVVGLLFAGNLEKFYFSPLGHIWFELGYFPVAY